MTTIADFPYEVVETTGDNALAKWEELKKAGRGAPVVLGEDLDNLMLPFDPTERERWKSVEEILAAAEAMDFPDDLRRMRRDEDAAAMVSLKVIGSLADYEEPEDETPLGDWSTEVSFGPEPSVAYEVPSGHPRSLVYIALIPTDDPTAIPAYLHWGDWNGCPAAAYHVAALRAWRDRYGAELIGLGFDTMNVRVARKPATRDEALELAREQHVYCSDIIHQGVGSYRAQAVALLESEWWYFWWD